MAANFASLALAIAGQPEGWQVVEETEVDSRGGVRGQPGQGQAAVYCVHQHWMAATVPALFP